jgi:threonine/homoserine/homoserine lactone efflux protein
MSLAALLTFAAIMFVGIITPGLTVLLALTNGSCHGLKFAAFGMLGAITADLPLVTLVGFGLGALLLASEILFSMVKWIGVVYLAFVGLKLIQTKSSAALDGLPSELDTPSPATAFSKSFVMAMSNPKYYLFMSAFLPQFVASDLPQVPQYALLGAIIVVIDLVAMFAYALFGYKAVRAFSGSTTLWLDRVSGGALLALAGSMALYRRAAA